MQSKQVTMQSAAGATGDGTVLVCEGMAVVRFQVSGTFVGTVTFETSINETNWDALECANQSDGSVATTATATGTYKGDIAGCKLVRARVSAWTSGTITVVGLAVAVGGGGVSADIDIAGQEDMNVAEVGGSAIALGQAAMAASMPVVIASDQTDVPITLDSEAVVLGAGTANVGKMDVPTATPTVYNVTLTNADTEYSQAMPANCRGFEFQCRTENDVRFAVVTGKVAAPTAPYMTLKAGDYYASFPINQAASPSTLYLASSVAGVIVEIIAWT